MSQTGLERAKTGLEKKFDQVRQVIHEKTAPKPPVSHRPPAPNGKPKATVRPKRKVNSKKPKGKR
jgi:hypothetical protein